MSSSDDLPEGSAPDDVESILVVDDEPSVRRFVSRVLIEAGFGVKEAADGLDALSLIRSGVSHSCRCCLLSWSVDCSSTGTRRRQNTRKINVSTT